MSGAHHIGSAIYADVGLEVWSTERRIVNDPIGGVVITVTENWDPDTGEPERAFETITPAGKSLRWHTISESELGPDSVNVPDQAVLLDLLRRCAGEVAWTDGRHRRSGTPDAHEARCARAVTVLAGVLGFAQERERCQRMLNPNELARHWRQLAEAVAMSSGPLSTDMAQRAFAVAELQFLVFGPDGPLHAVLDRPSPGKAAAPRPTAPPAPASWYVD